MFRIVSRMVTTAGNRGTQPDLRVGVILDPSMFHGSLLIIISWRHAQTSIVEIGKGKIRFIPVDIGGVAALWVDRFVIGIGAILERYPFFGVNT
jgi:hypothetical protein